MSSGEYLRSVRRTLPDGDMASSVGGPEGPTDCTSGEGGVSRGVMGSMPAWSGEWDGGEACRGTFLGRGSAPGSLRFRIRVLDCGSVGSRGGTTALGGVGEGGSPDGGGRGVLRASCARAALGGRSAGQKSQSVSGRFRGWDVAAGGFTREGAVGAGEMWGRCALSSGEAGRGGTRGPRLVNNDGDLLMDQIARRQGN